MDILTNIIGVMVLCVILQGGELRRLCAAFFFVCPVVLHEVFLAELDGFAYYFSAAMFDLVTIYALLQVVGRVRLVVYLQVLAAISVALNAGGWVLWMLYYPPGAYNVAFIALYSVAIIMMVWCGDDGLGIRGVDRWLPGIHSRYRQRNFSYLVSGAKKWVQSKT